MAAKIIWSDEAVNEFRNIISYLEMSWSETEVMNFISITNKTLEIIAMNPALFSVIHKPDTRQAVITKHNTLIYKYLDGEIYLVTFWDNRQDPLKKPF